MSGLPTARAYIDGFNLYRGALEGTPYKWLDLAKLSDSLMPAYRVEKVVYCSARLHADPRDPGLHLRQDIYWQALTGVKRIEIHEGHFTVRPTRMQRNPNPSCACCNSRGCPCCSANTVGVIKREEKGSDVQLAVQLVRDAAVNRFDAALVISGDSDIQPAIDIVQREFKKKVFVADPRNAKRQALRGTGRVQLTPSLLGGAQMPTTMVSKKGATVSKPTTW